VRAFAAQVAGLVGSFHEEKQIHGDQWERGTLRAAEGGVNTEERFPARAIRSDDPGRAAARTRATARCVPVDNQVVLVLDSSFPRATQNQQRIFHCG
jgi:hypothetical protein